MDLRILKMIFFFFFYRKKSQQKCRQVTERNEMKNCGSVRLNREIEKECDPTSRSIMIVVWKKKTCEQFESFSVKRNQTRTKLGLEIKIILYSTALELMSQTIQSTISHRTQFLVTLYTTLNYFLQLFERMIQRWKQV